MTDYPWLESAWSFFIERTDADRLAHAILLHGPAGMGKFKLGNMMAQRLLCKSPAEHACGECRSCNLFATGAHPDWFLRQPEEGKNQIVVDQVREVTASLALTTTISERKVALIHPAEAMNENAANALLKSLEEPPGDTVIILVADDASRLPVTIRSRCQAISVNPPAREQAIAWLQSSGGMDPGTAAEALEAAGGSPLQAVHYAGSDLVAAHAALRKDLARLLVDPAGVGGVAARLADTDSDILWQWLSRNSADALRGRLLGQGGNWLPNADKLNAAGLAVLQQKADRNRGFARSSVRQDLLLRDWLIEWVTRTR